MRTSVTGAEVAVHNSMLFAAAAASMPTGPDQLPVLITVVSAYAFAAHECPLGTRDRHSVHLS